MQKRSFAYEQEIAPKKKRKGTVPLEDLELIICTGANIRLSTMALSVLSENKVGVVIIGKEYMHSSIVLPYDANVRNAQIAKHQLCNIYENGLLSLRYKRGHNQ